MRILLSALIFSCSLLPLTAKADYESYESRYELAKTTAYEMTLDLCKPDGQTSLMAITGAGMYHTFYMFEEFDKATEVAPEVRGLIDSDGYYQALNECFGGDFEAKNSFTKKLLLASGAGSFAVGYGIAKIAQGISAALSGVSSWLSGTAWAAQNIRLAYMSQKAITALRLGIEYGPLVPVATQTTKSLTILTCLQINECASYYNSLINSEVLEKLQTENINPLAELELEMMMAYDQKLQKFEEVQKILKSRGQIHSPQMKKAIQAIETLKVRIQDLAISSKYPNPYLVRTKNKELMFSEDDLWTTKK